MIKKPPELLCALLHAALCVHTRFVAKELTARYNPPSDSTVKLKGVGGGISNGDWGSRFVTIYLYSDAFLTVLLLRHLLYRCSKIY